MRTLKRIGLFFLWVLIPSVITVSVNTFSPFTLGGLLTILLYAPFLYLIKKTLSGDFDGKYSKTNQKVSKLAEHSDDVSEPHLNEPTGTKQGVASEPDSEGTSKEAPAPEAEPETSPEIFSEEEPETAPASPSSADAFPKYCDNCGTECETWVKFCPVCGCKTFSVWVKKPLQVTSDPELLKKTDAKAHKYLFKKRVLIIALSVLCVALAIVSSVLYVNLQNVKKENAEVQKKSAELQDEVNELSTKTLQLRATNISLENEIASLKSKNNDLETRKNHFVDLYYEAKEYEDFLNQNIGLVVDGSNQYHTFDCEVFRSADKFFAHNIKYCEYLGYTPHSCFDN